MVALGAKDDEDSLPFSPRHALTAIGGFFAALGIAFTAVGQSPLALALILPGLILHLLCNPSYSEISP